MNVTNLSAGKWRLESESTPGKYYEVQYNSEQAKSAGVSYSCNCPSWTNNQYNRTCKHTKEIESLVQSKVMTMSNKLKTVPVPSYPFMGMARKRGRPSIADSARCPNCHKLSVGMKEYGTCRFCGGNKTARNKRGRYKTYRNEYSSATEVETSRPIDDDTVEVSDDALKEIANRLEL